MRAPRATRGRNTEERRPEVNAVTADLVLLAMGFRLVEHGGNLEQCGLQLDNRGNVVVQKWMTTAQGVFAAGDTVRGASLVVHAINQGREAAYAVHKWLAVV